MEIDFVIQYKHLTNAGYNVLTYDIRNHGNSAGGGYTVNAAINDRCIKAVATVSCVNIGAMFNRGWLGDQDIRNEIGLLSMGSQTRSAEANGSELAMLPLDPLNQDDATGDLIARAASESKTLYLVEDAGHMKLYDIPQYVDEAVSRLAPFFKTHLWGCPGRVRNVETRTIASQRFRT